MACGYCKTGSQKRTYESVSNGYRRCTVCGGIYSEDDTGITDLIYGKTWKERCVVRYALTDRYLILHVNRGAERPRGGLLGVLVAGAVQIARTDKTRYGFYALAELRHVVYPYRNNKMKKEEGIRFVFRDGSDFILRKSNSCSHLAYFLKAAGVEVIDGSDRHFGDRFCEKPFVDEDTADTRVCLPAAGEIQMLEGNRAVEMIGGAEAESFWAKQKPVPLLYTIYHLNLNAGSVFDLRDRNLIMLEDLLSKRVAELRAMGVKEATLLNLAAQREVFGLKQGEGAEQLYAPPHIPAVEVEIDDVEESTPPQPAVETKDVEDPVVEEATEEPSAPTAQPAAEIAEEAPQSAPKEFKFCHKCGEKLERDDVFCPECGTKQRR